MSMETDTLAWLEDLLSKASPGPWRLWPRKPDIGSHGEVPLFSSSPTREIAYFATSNDGEGCSHDPEEAFPAIANAQLAALAPDLAQHYIDAVKALAEAEAHLKYLRLHSSRPVRTDEVLGAVAKALAAAKDFGKEHEQ